MKSWLIHQYSWVGTSAQTKIRKVLDAVRQEFYVKPTFIVPSQPSLLSVIIRYCGLP